MGRAANLKVNVIADTKGAGKELDGFSSKVAGFTAGLTAGVAGFALDKLAQGATAAAGYLVEATKDAASLRAALATTQQVFGDATDDITAWSKKAADALGLSQQKALVAARGFASYGKVLGLQGRPLADFTKNIATLAADLGAYADLPTEQAIEAIGSAFRSERDPLERFNIILTDAEVKAAYFRETGEKVTGTLTTQQNIIGTLRAITEKSTDATGAFAREQDELGGATQRNEAKFDNLKAKIGEVLLPAMEGLTNFVGETLLPGLENFSTWLSESETGKKLQEFAGWVKDVALEALKSFEKFAREELLPRLGEVATKLSQMSGDVDRLAERWRSLTGDIDKSTQSFGGLSGVLGILVTASWQPLLAVIRISLAQFNLVLLIVQACWRWFMLLVDAIGSLISKVEELARLNLPNILGPLGGLVGAGLGAVFGRSAGPGAGRGRATYSYSPTFVVNAAVPLGIHAGDVGSAIVDELRRWEARNGPAQLGPAAWGN